MAKAVQRSMRAGFGLFVKKAGDDKFKQVGTFSAPDLAYAAGKAKYPEAKLHVEGVRVSVVPVDAPLFKKKGGQNARSK